MAGFGTKTFTKHDDYMTPFSAWDNIKQFIPKDKVIWESFYGNGESGTHLQKLFCDTDDPIQIIIPRKRIQFEKLVNGEKVADQKQDCNFDCFYYCWKWGLERDIIWLKNIGE
jgi:hypothetical protein